jgi:hypothetical protein
VRCAALSAKGTFASTEMSQEFVIGQDVYAPKKGKAQAAVEAKIDNLKGGEDTRTNKRY